LGWTWDHRGKILYALFLILMTPHERNEGTRFKEWQQLVGSSVEFAANGRDVPEEQWISFREILREGDDDAMDYAAVLGVLFGLFPPLDANPTAGPLEKSREFDTIQVLKKVGGSNNTKPKTEEGDELPEEILNLRLWLTTYGANGPTIRSIPKMLKSIDGTPVLVEGGTMILHARQDTNKKKPLFQIEFHPHLNPDGTKAPEAEARDRDAAAARAKCVEEAQRNVDEALKRAATVAHNPFTDPIPPTAKGPVPDPQRPPFQPGEPKMSAMEDLVAKTEKEPVWKRLENCGGKALRIFGLSHVNRD
jgi:hypothetical protein